MDADPAHLDAAPPAHRGSPVAEPHPSAVAPPLRDARAARVTSQQLFGQASEVLIDHHGVLYRLKQTSLGKLILTK